MYKWNPGDYNKSSSEQLKWAREIISGLGLRGNEKVLDIGCGDGKVTAEIARHLHGGRVIGLDNSREMIEFAREGFRTEDYPNLSFHLGDARKLVFSSEFDLIVSFASLHWVIGHQPVLEGIGKALKPSGRIFLQFGGKGNAGEILQEGERVISRDKWKKYFKDFRFPWGFYGPEEYEEWLEKAGLITKRVELIPKDMVHKGKIGLKGWIETTWLPYLQRIPEKRQQEFIEEILDIYIEMHPVDREGIIHLKMMRLEVEAVRGG